MHTSAHVTKTPAHAANFRMGAQLGAIIHTGSNVSLPAMIAKEATMQSPAGVPFQRQLCKIACAAFEADNEAMSKEAILFRNLASTPEWHSSFNKFTDCVARALGKSAAILPLVAAAHDKTGGGLLKTLTGAGVLGGATLGSLAFILSRNAEQSSSDNEALLEKVRAYKQLKRDLREDMASSGVMDNKPEKKRYAV